MKGAMHMKKGNYGKSKGAKVTGGLKGSKSTKQIGSMKSGSKSKGY